MQSKLVQGASLGASVDECGKKRLISLRIRHFSRQAFLNTYAALRRRRRGPKRQDAPPRFIAELSSRMPTFDSALRNSSEVMPKRPPKALDTTARSWEPAAG